MTESVCSDVTDGPVIAVINKRIRALRKKLNRILQMEDSLTRGKTLNKEQEETFRSKPMVLAAIDELEKLKQPISLALSEEISSAVKQQQLNTPQSTNSTSESSEICNTKEEVKDELKKEEIDSGKQKEWAVQDLLNLLYFGSMFDVKSQNDFTSTMLTRTHERGCCLTYDYVTDDDDALLLAERDLDMISMLGGLLLSRPVDSSLSHRNTLQRCVEHAMLWLNHSDQPIEPNSELTYAGLWQKLEKIIASDYFTTPPTMRAPGDVAAYGAYQVPPVHEQVASVNLADQVEVSPEHHGHRSATDELQEEETVLDVVGNVNNDQSGGVVVAHNEGVEGGSFPQVHVQTEQQVVVQEEEVDQGREYVPRGPYQNQRGGGRGMNGGGRRGYPGGGRGSFRGEGYLDGRNHYHDQVGGSSYPRDNYYRGRGGRGSGSYPNPNHYEGGVGGQGGGYRRVAN